MFVRLILFILVSLIAANYPAQSASLTLTKTGTGLIYGDNFNGNSIDTTMWTIFQGGDPGITMQETGGELVVAGTAQTTTCMPFSGVHALAWCQRHHYDNSPGPAVMAGKLRIPMAPDAVQQDFDNGMTFHFCNINPDMFAQISFRSGRQCGPQQNAPALQYQNCVSLPPAVFRSGFKLFLSYKDGQANGFVVNKDTVTSLGTQAVNLENNKRMELKSYCVYTGRPFDFRFDWAAVYSNPLVSPAVFIVNSSIPGVRLTLQMKGPDTLIEATGNGTFRFNFPENRIFPDSATVSVYGAGSNLLGSANIPYDGQLNGLFPGDTFVIGPQGAGISGQISSSAEGAALEVFPNPVTALSAVAFLLDKPCLVEIRVFDVKGRLVKSIAKRSFLGTGFHRLEWDGGKLLSGLYYLVLSVQGQKAIKPVLVLK